MSDLYPTGQLDPFIRTALDRAALVRDIYRRVANVQHPDTWHPLGVICPTCGKVGTTIVTDWDGENGLLRVPRASTSSGRPAAAHSGWVSPFGGAAKLPWNLEWAAQWSLFGVTIEPNGKDLADGRRLARPQRRDRPRGVRARAAAQRPVRVPEHRRQEDVDVEGPRRRRAPDRRGRAARSSSGSCSSAPGRTRPSSSTPTGPTPIPRLFDEFDRFAARDRRPRGEGRAPAGLRGDLPLLAARPGRGLGGRGGRVPPGVRPPGAAAPDPRRGRRRADRPRRRGAP